MSTTSFAALLLALVGVHGLQEAETRTGCVPTSKHQPPPPKSNYRPPPPHTPRTMTIFGDSTSDDGTNEFPRTNYTVPDPRYYPGGRTTNGPVWGEYMVNASTGTLASVSNYAYVGAYACVQPGHIFGPVPDSERPLYLPEQVARYLNATSLHNRTAPNVVVIVGTGYNDLIAALGLKTPGSSITTNLSTSIAAVTGCMMSAAATLAAAGETHIAMGNYVLSKNSPLLLTNTADQRAQINAGVIKFDLALKRAIIALQTTLPHTKLYYLDAHGILDTLYDNAMAAGVTSMACLITDPPNASTLYGPLSPNITTTECASKGAGYFWYDHEHPSTVYHAAMAASYTKLFHMWGLY